MKIAVIKPDWRIRGGFEKVLDRVEQDLSDAGHELRRVVVDVPGVRRRAFGIDIPPAIWDRSAQWFTHLALLEAFRELDVSWADLVISTQPPSYAVRHPRHLALFYHHARAFYDLEQLWVRSGMAPEVLHTVGSALLRQAESADLDGVTRFLAGSERVQERLRQFQGPNVPLSLYQAAGPSVVDSDHQDDDRTYVLCVSRHEFTKRTELLVAALSATADAVGILVGDGGRLPLVRALAADLADGRDREPLTDEQLWLNDGITGRVHLTGLEHPRISVRGRVGDDELAALYRNALCVVAPAYDEDDGLTVAEAMSHGKPVIVCRDGGGLTALVRDGVNGFIVEPTAEGIAAAIETLVADPELARRMGAEAIGAARERTPERARAQLLSAVDAVMSIG